MIILFTFILGLCIGSFLLVITDRFESNESFLHGRSHCDQCKHVLGPLDLIPVISFLSTKGRCRYCKVKLSLYYPFFELLTGCLFALTIFVSSSTYYGVSIDQLLHFIFSLYIVSSLILLFFIDLRYGIIPFKIIFPAILITFLSTVFSLPSALSTTLYAALGACLFFFLLFLFTKGRGMGFGDVVYAFFMGLLLGYPGVIVGLYIAFLSGAIISLILIWEKKKKLKGSTIPFGPFLVLGTYIAWLWGDMIVSWVLNFLYSI
ncbi:A24 family peptidase [soil metagenome]